MARTIAGAAPGRTNRRFLIIAVLLATVSALLVYARISATDEGGSTSTAIEGTTQVVVARTDIRQRTTITAEMLELKTVPIDAAVLGVFRSPTDAIGKVTKYPLQANQQIAATAVVDTSSPADAALAYVVPTGKRAISISASQVNNAGGLILPGDYVDLVWMCCKDEDILAKTLLKNVQVAAIAQTIVPSGPVAGQEGGEPPVAGEVVAPVPDAVTMTVLLSPDEAELIYLAEGTGKIRATLRGVGDEQLPLTGIKTFTDILTPEEIAALPDGLPLPGYAVTP